MHSQHEKLNDFLKFFCSPSERIMYDNKKKFSETYMFNEDEAFSAMGKELENALISLPCGSYSCQVIGILLP
jgi:hypothetical protein